MNKCKTWHVMQEKVVIVYFNIEMNKSLNNINTLTMKILVHSKVIHLKETPSQAESQMKATITIVNHSQRFSLTLCKKELLKS